MIAPVGSTCLFVFATPFASLNGIYTIVKTMSFETALSSGVNFTTSLYVPAGRTAADYAAEYTSFAGQIVLQLQGVGDASETTYYAPLGTLGALPDPTVKRYSDVYMAIHIGAFADETVYTWLKGQIDDLVASVTGNTDTSQFYSNPSDDVYLTDGQYQALVTSRAAKVTTVNPLTTQIQSLQAQIATLQTLVAAYENNFIALNTAQIATTTTL